MLADSICSNQFASIMLSQSRHRMMRAAILGMIRRGQEVIITSCKSTPKVSWPTHELTCICFNVGTIVLAPLLSCESSSRTSMHPTLDCLTRAKVVFVDCGGQNSFTPSVIQVGLFTWKINSGASSERFKSQSWMLSLR